MNHQPPHDSAEGSDRRRVSEFVGRRTAECRVRRPAFSLWRTLNADHGAGKMPPKAMIDTTENLILDLIEWVGRRERTYQETMDAWRTSCPRLPVWEDASERGLVETASANGRSIVRATSAGLAFLNEKRPHAYRELQVQKDP